MRRVLIIALFAALPVSAQTLDLVSQMDDLAVASLDNLPRNPAGPLPADICGAVQSPESAEGRAVAAKGWGVTSEVQVHGVSLVGFVGRAEPGTSGMCQVSDGNVAVFQEGRLAGLIYGQAGWRRSIGSVAVRESSLRLWSGDFLPVPLADLRLHGADLIVVTPVASQDSFCAGTITLPNLYGIPVHLARRFLLDQGWVPQKSAEPLAGDWMSFGLEEAQGCSGTGANFCSFGYMADNGATLSVFTAGEAEPPNSPSVIDAEVMCPGEKAE